MATTKLLGNTMDSDFPVPFPIYTRVTEVLAPFSGMSKIDPIVLANASARGTWVHDNIECMQEGLPIEKNHPEWVPYLDSYEAWAKNKCFISKPTRFYDDELMITGECDAIWKDGDDLVLVDFKTSANEGKTWKYQGAAYEYLARKNGYNIKRVEFIKVSKEGKPAKTYGYSGDSTFKKFVGLLDVYREFFQSNKSDMGDL